MAPTLEQSTDTYALGVDGNTPTCSVAGDNYEGLTSKALKKLCSERGLAVRGDRAALVGRLRAGKKAGPKSSNDRKAKSRANRSQAKVVADRALNTKQKAKSRANRTDEQKKADRALNREQVSAHRTTRSQAKVVADRARNAAWMEQARANRTEDEVVADRALPPGCCSNLGWSSSSFLCPASFAALHHDTPGVGL
jgi:hypothetical protein